MTIYGKKLKKSSSLEPKGRWPWNLTWVLEYYQVCSNDDPGFTMTYFTARSNLVPYAFVWEKGQTMDFSETIAVYDFKLATHDRSDKKFLLTSKLCPLNFKDFFLNLQKMTEVTRCSCWHQTFVHKGLSAPTPGLYTCINAWKKNV